MDLPVLGVVVHGQQPLQRVVDGHVFEEFDAAPAEADVDEALSADDSLVADGGR